jgi:phenylacetate-CoA ligase
MWAERRRRGDASSWERLENWPVLDKDALRAAPQRFVADDRDPRKLFHVHTSGTTGKPVNVWYGRGAAREWYALFEARCRRRYGVSLDSRWANVGGQLVTPTERRRPPFWVWNAALKQLYMSSYHLAPDLIPYYLDALLRYRIEYLCGYTSSLFELAEGALRLGRRDLKMRVALTNAEPVFAYQRQAIEEAFGCPVRETYGMAEMAAGASECEEGRMHLWPEASVVEVFRDGRPQPPGASGELVSTCLVNEDMPLVRYRLGDTVTLAAAGESCACGRTLPLLASIEGRSDDLLYTADGRCIGRLDPVFKADLPVREAQIVQESLDRVRVRYVPAGEFTAEAARSIRERLRERMGEVEVVLEPIGEIPRGANGKFRAVVCSLPEEQRLALRGARPA